MLRPYLITLGVPLVLIALAIPLILERVPPNHVYGFRTPYTMSSSEVWYRANRISGIALLTAGIVWLGLAFVVPATITPPNVAFRYVVWGGLAGVTAAVAVSFWLVYRR